MVVIVKWVFYDLVKSVEIHFMSTISERLRQARMGSGLTLEKAADALGTSYNTIWRHEAGQHVPRGPTLHALASLYGTSVEWLTGKDEPVTVNSIVAIEGQAARVGQEATESALPGREVRFDSETPAAVHDERVIQGTVKVVEDLRVEIRTQIDALKTEISSIAERQEDSDLSVHHVAIVEVAASAGAGMHIEDAPVKGTLAFRREWLDSNSIDPVQCSIIGVAGESMEPTLVEGCSILVDRSNYRRRRREGRIFVINAEEGLIVKRAAKDTAGDWFIESDHPAWDPEPWPENAEVVGEVRWMARTF